MDEKGEENGERGAGFCYIKYVTGPNIDQKQYVNAKRIPHFDVNKGFTKGKFYKVHFGEKVHSCYILGCNESKEKLQEIIQKSGRKRTAAVPNRFGITESESDAPTSKKCKQQKGKTTDKKQQKSKTAKAPKFVPSDKSPSAMKELLERKTAALTKKHLPDLNLESNDLLKKDEISIVSELDKNTVREIEEAKIIEDNSQEITQKNPPSPIEKAEHTNESQNPLIINNHSDADADDSSIDDNSFAEEEKKKKSTHTQAVSATNTLDECQVCEKNDRVYRKKQLELTTMKEQLNKLESETIKLKEELEESRKINESLGKALAIHHIEQNDIWNKLSNASLGTVTYEKNFHPVEHIRDNPYTQQREVHAGRNIWISESSYNFVRNKALNPSLFVGHLLQAVFHDSLKDSTISGYTTKHGVKVQCKQLDTKRVGACKDLYVHWLLNTYAKSKSAAKIKYDVHEDLSMFDKHATKKINDYNKAFQPKKQTKPKKSKEPKKTAIDKQSIEPSQSGIETRKAAKKNYAEYELSSEEDNRVQIDDNTDTDELPDLPDDTSQQDSDSD